MFKFNNFLIYWGINIVIYLEFYKLDLLCFVIRFLNIFKVLRREVDEWKVFLVSFIFFLGLLNVLLVSNVKELIIVLRKLWVL